jgi:hypothetical protein
MAVATKFAGKVIHFSIESQVDHPQGKGRSLRFKPGVAVRTDRTILKLVLPLTIVESQAAALAPTTETLWTLGEPFTRGFPVLPASTKSVEG